jgi:hypothetical protein
MSGVVVVVVGSVGVCKSTDGKYVNLVFCLFWGVQANGMDAVEPDFQSAYTTLTWWSMLYMYYHPLYRNDGICLVWMHGRRGKVHVEISSKLSFRLVCVHCMPLYPLYLPSVVGVAVSVIDSGEFSVVIGAVVGSSLCTVECVSV